MVKLVEVVSMSKDGKRAQIKVEKVDWVNKKVERIHITRHVVLVEKHGETGEYRYKEPGDEDFERYLLPLPKQLIRATLAKRIA